jgi:hypothetical protein
MSNIGTKIEKLVSNGFTYNTLRGLNESQIGLLYTRLVEAQTKTTTSTTYTGSEISAMRQKGQPIPGGKAIVPNPDGGITVQNEGDDSEDEYYTTKVSGQLSPDDETNMPNDGMDDDSGNDRKMMGETEVTEKFQSKSQQRLFWAKCENSRTEKAKRKWCKWAKEFSDDTDFSKLPEKKKKDMQELEESLTKLIEKHIPEHITKGQLMKMFEGSTKSAPAPTKVPTVKPGEKVKQPGKKNPFKIEPAQKPNPRAEMTEAGVGAPAPTKAPVKTPTKTPSKAPGKKNPFKIEPAQKPNPKAKGPKWLSYNTFTSMGYTLK